MDNMIQVQVGSGKIVLPESVTTFSSVRVTAPFLRESAHGTGVRSMPSTMQNISRHGTLHGSLYSATVGHEAGTVIMLTASRTTRGFPVSDAAILLRLRAGAAVINAGAKLPPARENDFGNRFCMFSGHADVLSIEEAAVLGIFVPARYAEKFFVASDIDKHFDLMELTPETTPRPEYMIVATASGVVTREVAATPQRRIKVRK